MRLAAGYSGEMVPAKLRSILGERYDWLVCSLCGKLVGIGMAYGMSSWLN